MNKNNKSKMINTQFKQCPYSYPFSNISKVKHHHISYSKKNIQYLKLIIHLSLAIDDHSTT